MPTAFIQKLDDHPTTTYVLPRSATRKPLTITQPWPSGPIPRGTTNTKQYFIDAPPYSVFNYTSFAPGSNNIDTFGQANFADNTIRLTAAVAGPQTGSAFFQPKLAIYKSFTTGFNLDFTSPSADGATFVIQNSASNALGDGGLGLGYSNILNSVAIRFYTSYYDNKSDSIIPGIFSTDILTGGSVPTAIAASGDINNNLAIRSNDPIWNFDVTISYTGTTLSYTMLNTSNGGNFSSNAAYDIPTTIGSSNAWVGFTATTDDPYSQACSISAWNWSNSK
jgi:hypothetical protein